MSNKGYVLFCDEKYYYLMRNVLRLLDKFSENKVLAYTVNFLPTESFKNVIWKRIDDPNLLEYETTGKNDLIKNDWDKTMYSCFLKASIVADSLETDLIDEFLYLDVDTFPTRYIDSAFLAGQEKATDYPILSRYLWELMIYGEKGNPHTEHGYDEKKTLEWWLIKKLGLDNGGYKRDWYRSSCFFYYNKDSKPFWEEARKILTDKEMFRDQNEFFGDESIINVLLWKYKHTEYFDNMRAIHIENGDQLNSIDKIDDFFEDLKGGGSGPSLVTNWDKESHPEKSWMFHGKISKFFWRENILSGKRSYDEKENERLNDYFLHKISCAF
jgi:hypothetical protein